MPTVREIPVWLVVSKISRIWCGEVRSEVSDGIELTVVGSNRVGEVWDRTGLERFGIELTATSLTGDSGGGCVWVRV
ncbi:hypothetical protein Q3G72_016870 [Acer saccharum]|nr:hypothetical protein Q3G72_016870 [Acer saccharum]